MFLIDYLVLFHGSGSIFSHQLTILNSDCNWAPTRNHLVHKRTLNHLAKLAK